MSVDESSSDNNSLHDDGTETAEIAEVEVEIDDQQLFGHNSFDADCQSFDFVDLVGHTGRIYALELSSDGSLLASGGQDEIVRLWPISKAENGRTDPRNLIIPIQMETRSCILSLAFSPDNNRLFSGGSGKKFLIHDVQT